MHRIKVIDIILCIGTDRFVDLEYRF
ncbi:uncharacterized protein METZ01_LOCUS202967 [marine metagenome]|uniref:Uncharacterized protein n=1 Tax=marine metagenome TaxID=408172 RepID=A0A382EJL7_9ZZZZ